MEWRASDESDCFMLCTLIKPRKYRSPPAEAKWFSSTLVICTRGKDAVVYGDYCQYNAYSRIQFPWLPQYIFLIDIRWKRCNKPSYFYAAINVSSYTSRTRRWMSSTYIYIYIYIIYIYTLKNATKNTTIYSY